MRSARSRTAAGKDFRKAAEQTNAAAAPSPIGAHIARVSGQLIKRSSNTCCGETSKRYCANGFFAPIAWFFDAPNAICAAVVPCRFMCQAACIA